jgi:hypothetical protein
MPETLLQVPAQLTKLQSMSHRSLRAVFDSQENLDDETMAKMMSAHEKVGWLVFASEPVQANTLVDLPPLTFEKDEKTPGMRLRASLFRLWEKKRPTDTFAAFYEQQMERFINAVQEKLN